MLQFVVGFGRIVRAGSSIAAQSAHGQGVALGPELQRVTGTVSGLKRVM